MAQDFAVYGEIDASGKVIRDVATCSATGQPIIPGDLLVNIPDTRYFYRLKAGLWDVLSESDKAKLATGAKSAPKVSEMKDGT